MLENQAAINESINESVKKEEQRVIEAANRRMAEVHAKKAEEVKFREVYCKEGWEWGYFSFRPGVKRMKDYQLIGGYEKYKNELDIGVTYKKLGYYTVILEKQAVEDIGLDQTIFDPTRKWPDRRKTNAPTGLKRLWKHLRNFKF